VSGPVDTTAAIGADAFGACLQEVAADEAVDAVVAIGVKTALADLSRAITSVRISKPMAVVLLDQAESVRLLPAGDGDVDRDGGLARRPAYAYPESAVRAIGHAAGYQAWRAGQRGRVPALDGTDPAAARSVARAYLSANREGGWLPAAAAQRLLAAYGVSLVTSRAGTGGVDTHIAVVQEPVFGPLVVFGLGGVASGVPGDDVARLSPLTDTDAKEMISGVRGAPLLTGRDGAPAPEVNGLAGVLLRVSRLADDVPEVAELDLSPVIAGPADVRVAGVRVRLAPAVPADPFLRRLR
jgi:acyl-CoA synthetase (NDP forming)